jgi:S-formylglutathione hydrolase FrmB
LCQQDEREERGVISPSRVEQPLLTSRVLEGNPLGDPHIRTVPVYVPAGYDDSPARHYPVLVMLSGYGGSGPLLLNLRPWDESLPQQLDRLIRSGAMAPALVVMPDCWTRYGGSQYLNSSALGRYEDYLIEEVIPFVDARYRTLPDRAHRGIAGKSSGGYGALVQGMHHPEVFGAVACHSGDMYFEFCYMGDLAKLHANLASYGGWPKLRDELHAIRPKDTKFFQTLATLCYGMAYAPNPEAPDGFELPIDVGSGALNEAAWARWLSHDPVRKLDDPRYVEALRSLKLLYVDAGDRDEFSLQVGARVLVQRLQGLGIDHYFEEFPDGHFNIQYRYDTSLPMLSAALQP